MLALKCEPSRVKVTSTGAVLRLRLVPATFRLGQSGRSAPSNNTCGV